MSRVKSESRLSDNNLCLNLRCLLHWRKKKKPKLLEVLERWGKLILGGGQRRDWLWRMGMGRGSEELEEEWSEG